MQLKNEDGPWEELMQDACSCDGKWGSAVDSDNFGKKIMDQDILDSSEE